MVNTHEVVHSVPDAQLVRKPHESLVVTHAQDQDFVMDGQVPWTLQRIRDIFDVTSSDGKGGMY